ncbi:MAG: dipeptide epimerase [Actinomycetota bacterium]
MARAKWTLDVSILELPLAERFTIATESWDAARNVFVRLGYDGITGVGEVSPGGRWEETPESVEAELQAVDLDALSGPFDIEGISTLLPAGSARCALDIALHDLAAKLAALSVAELLGLGARPLPVTSVTVPIAEVHRMAARARALSDHPVLKMKLGFEGDVDAVRVVRRAYDGALRVDANEGWSVEEAPERLKALEPFDIELCEQPIRAGYLEALRRVTESTSIPIFADEDVGTSADVARLHGIVDGVNLKLRKAGGIRETVKAMATARAQGMRVMLGCDLESGVAATAQASVASLVDHADLDGPLLLAEDPYPGVTYSRGTMALPEGPGLGLRRSPP